MARREELFEFWRKELGLENITIHVEATLLAATATGHEEVDDDLTSGSIQVDPSLDEREWELTLVHEMLHVAFRHATEFSKAFMPPRVHVLAWEEDIERLAVALVNGQRSRNPS